MKNEYADSEKKTEFTVRRQFSVIYMPQIVKETVPVGLRNKDWWQSDRRCFGEQMVSKDKEAR